MKDHVSPVAAAGPRPDREEFLNRMIGSLSETIEDVVGVEDAESFIGVVGRRIGNSDLAEMPATEDVDAKSVGDHLAEFKRRIGGEFQVTSIDGATVTFENTRCPFGAEVTGRTSLCQMTTNVFGRVAANATGYANVCVHKAISRGDPTCVVTVRLAREAKEDDGGQDFYG
ncbi:methanogen output domain 1-containing protein [Pseudooceanicola sp. MF1-13]|uniref:methanogen output domain 1-containing protein n=1 Tax=Pseudooceanicola sp. MF1-13 TaxID=3379095 RepID=UPI00389267CC